MTETKAGEEQEGSHSTICPPWASISIPAPSCALAPGAMGGLGVPACPRGTADMPWKASLCPQKLQPTARFVLQAFAGRTVSLRCVQGCSHRTCQGRIHSQPWKRCCSSARKMGRHFSVPCLKCHHMGFAEHGCLSREMAGPWKRRLAVVPLSKTAGCWLRAQMAAKASIFLQ